MVRKYPFNSSLSQFYGAFVIKSALDTGSHILEMVRGSLSLMDHVGSAVSQSLSAISCYMEDGRFQ